MEKFFDLCRANFREIGFGVLVLLIWFSLIAVLNPQTTPESAIFDLCVDLLCLFAAAGILSETASKVAQIHNLRIGHFFGSVLLAVTAAVFVSDPKNDAAQSKQMLIAIAVIWLLFLMLSEGVMYWQRRRLAKKAEKLEETEAKKVEKAPAERSKDWFNTPKPEAKTIRIPEILSEEQEVALFDEPDAIEKVSAYIEKYRLCDRAQTRLFEPKFRGELLEKYFEKWKLEAQDVMLFDLPNAFAVFAKYVEHWYLSLKGELKMLEQLEAAKFLEKYLSSESSPSLQAATEFKLFEVQNSAELVRIYLSHHWFESDNAELKMFDLPNVAELVELYLEHGYEFGSIAEPKLLDLPNADAIMLRYVDDENLRLSDEAQVRLFNLPSARKLLETYLSFDNELCEEAQCRLVELPNGEALISLFVENHELCEEAQCRLVKLPNVADAVGKYIENNDLCEEAVDGLFMSPDASKLLKIYLASGNRLSGEQQSKLLALPNADELAEEFVKQENEFEGKAEITFVKLPNAAALLETYLDRHYLSEHAQLTMLSLPNAAELLKVFLQSDELCDEAEKQLFDLPYASALLKVYLEADKDLSYTQQVRLFNLPNRLELVELFLKSENEFCEEAQCRLVEIPDSAELILAYMENNDFCEEAENKLFDRDDAVQILTCLIDKGYEFYGNNEVRLFDLPNAEKMVDSYIHHHCMAEDAEYRLFELPEARRLIELYRQGGELSGDALALAQAKGWIEV